MLMLLSTMSYRFKILDVYLTEFVYWLSCIVYKLMRIPLISVDTMYLVVLLGLIEIAGKKEVVTFHSDNLYHFMTFAQD